MTECPWKPEVALPADFPGRTAIFPADARHVAYAILGVQGKDEGAAAPVALALKNLLRGPDGPGALERFHFVDPQGYHTDLFLAGWLDTDGYRAWLDRAEVAAWWRGLSCTPDAPVGVWREVMTPHKDYFQHGGALDDKVGFAALGSLVPCAKFGYWGGYRDRIPASAHDTMLTPLDAVPRPRRRETRGMRVGVAIPDNLCFIREGQSWDQAGATERAIWADQMDGVVDQWVGHLRDNPVETGCLSLRCAREVDVDTGAVRGRQSQIGFLLSLRHIERAARTVPAHLAVKNTFTAMYTEPQFEPRMHIWVEMFILKSGDLDTEYVNCHPETGLLPYFEVLPVVAASRATSDSTIAI